jgi:hypothetical protein
MHDVLKMVMEALADDARHQDGKFDAATFDAMFADKPIADVAEAWTRYCAIHEGNETITDLIKALA